MLLYVFITDSEDYDSAFISILEFIPCNRTVCSKAGITIKNDEIVEETETITLGLQSRGSIDSLIRIKPANSLIEITDTADSKRELESVCVCGHIFDY